MRKAEMTFEGTLRQHVKKRGEHLDVSYYGILREEWPSARGTAGGTAATE
jgi:RimJ/RimL family protein N-acetyltransferase